MNPVWNLLVAVFFLGVHGVRIEENGYKGITISFSERSLQTVLDFNKLKDVLRNASELLFHATKNRSYFEEFILVVPSKWADIDVCDEDDETEVPKSIDIYVTDSAEISQLTTQHSKGCGQKGDIIYLPTDWLAGNAEELAHQFVRQWSTYRYGVFSENPERPGSCIATSGSSWSPNGCYNIKLDTKASIDGNGLPVCDFPDNFEEDENLTSSIMFSLNSSKVLNFCDGSESFPHNPVAETLHNRICEGNTVWSVIKNSEDFLYGRNLPVEEAKPSTFRCFKESKTHMTLIIQDTDSAPRTEIRYALLYFLTNIAATDLSVTLATFSNETLTEAMDPTELALQDKEKLKSLLVTYLKLNKKVSNICLTCGLRKAYKISAERQHPLRVIVLFAHASSLQNTETSELTEIIKSSDGNPILHLIFLEDTENDIIPSPLVDIMQDGGGRIFRVKNDSVLVFTQMNIALLDASKNILHIEDKTLVVYQKIHTNVASNFFDVFLAPKKVKGKLLYSMQCKKRGDIRSIDDSCFILDQELQSPICESKSELDGTSDSSKVWKYSFEYMAGSEGTTCVSLAMLKLDYPSTDSFTVKGWLNENKITPGHNALIIYAEVIGRVDEDIDVEAMISGPGLTDFRLELRDNGNGDPDVIKGDNIYSRYFTSFTQKGTYTVSIFATELITKESSETTENISTRTKVIGSFRVTESPPKEDVIPPNRVCDLNVISIDSTNRTVLLQWTAPGNNYDGGKAKKYTIKLSKHWMSLLDFTFDLKENVMLNTDEFLPANSGTTENLRIQYPKSNDNGIYYVALKAIDHKDNMGKISNIIQIPFKEDYVPITDSVLISTETSKDSSYLVSTEAPVSTSMTPENETLSQGNTTVITTTEEIEGIFIEKKILVIAASTSGAILIIVIIISIIICCYCYRRVKNAEKPKKISRKASLRPPYNLNIAYRRGSQSSLEETAVSNSMSTLVEPNGVYYNSDERRSQAQHRYIYHTNGSLKNKTDNSNKKGDLGFKLVQPMPAYATSSLSRFAARHEDTDDDDPESLNTRSNGLEHQNLNNVQDTHVYSLGPV